MSGPSSIGGDRPTAPTLDTDKVVIGPTLPESPTGSIQQSGMNTRAAEVAVFVALGVAVLFFLLPLSSSNAVATEEEQDESGWVQKIATWFQSDEAAEDAASAEAAYGGAPAEAPAAAPAYEVAEAPSEDVGYDPAADATKAPVEAPNDEGTGGGYYVDVANTTGSVIQAIYVNGASATDWGPNRLDGEQLQDGYKIRIHLGAQPSTMFDIRLVDLDGNSYNYGGVDISKYDITAKASDKDAKEQ